MAVLKVTSYSMVRYIPIIRSMDVSNPFVNTGQSYLSYAVK